MPVAQVEGWTQVAVMRWAMVVLRWQAMAALTPQVTAGTLGTAVSRHPLHHAAQGQDMQATSAPDINIMTRGCQQFSAGFIGLWGCNAYNVILCCCSSSGRITACSGEGSQGGL